MSAAHLMLGWNWNDLSFMSLGAFGTNWESTDIGTSATVSVYLYYNIYLT